MDLNCFLKKIDCWLDGYTNGWHDGYKNGCMVGWT